MTRKAGIPLVDLFAITDQINSALPQSIQDFIDRFTVIEHRTTRSPAAIFHHGKVQSLTSVVSDGAEEMDIGIGKLSIPLIHGGLQFQLSMARAAIASNLEPAAQSWQLDLVLVDFALTLDGLEPALYIAESGSTPRHLLRDRSRTGVKIIGSAVLRIEKPSPNANIEVRFIDKSDPLDPTMLSGAVAELNFSPPHFFLGRSDFGLSVGRIQFDFSEIYSPPNILEQNQGPAWVGLAIQEATVYAPRNLPLIGDLSGGVKNVLFGRPMGIQGEFEIQFGRTALNPSTFQFKQALDNDSLAIGGSGTSRTVAIEASQDDEVIISAGFTAPAPPADGSLPAGALQEWSGSWNFPNGSGQTGDSASGRVRHGQVLRVTPVETVTVAGTTTTHNHPEITFRFIAAGTAPAVTATVGSENFANLIHLNGTIADISTLTLTASSTTSSGSEFVWQIPGNSQSHTGITFTPNFNDLTGQQWVVLRETVSGEDSQRITRIRVQLNETIPLLLGCENGVFNVSDDSTSLGLSAVEATYDLSDFHAQGAFNTTLNLAVLDASESARVAVPNDALAQVTISSGGSATVHEYDRHVQIEMVFEEDVVIRWGIKKPVRGGAAANEVDLQGQLLEWASYYPGAEFIVIGRCDDIGRGESLGLGEFPDPFNITLALDRATKGKSLLTMLLSGASGSAIDSSRVFIRGESAAWAGTNANGNTLEEDSDISLFDAEKSEAVSQVNLLKGWLIKTNHSEHSTWVNNPDTSKTYESIRQQYRRVDIYAVGGTPTDEAIVRTGEAAVAPTLRRSMVPADDRVPTTIPSSAPAIDYRVKLKIVWDSPTVTDWRDAIPTLAEAEFAWTPTEMPIPSAGGEAVELSRETLMVYAKWVHDSRTEFTQATLGIRSEGDPDGLFHSDNKHLAAAAALGPMLLSGVDLENDVIGSGARIAALISAAGFAGVDMGDGPLVGTGSKTAVMGIEAQAQTRALSDPTEDYQIRLTTDYVCTLHINGGALGIKTAADKPVKIRYKNVGVEFDNSKEGWNKIGMAYETDCMEIEDSGKWEISGILGQLLRLVEISFGRGSMWIEGRIAIAISIGVVEISEAIIRLTWKDGSPLPDFELRGFVLKADIPNVLKGEGRLRIEDGGVIRAGVDASIIPLGLACSAGIAFGKPPEIDPDVFLELFLGVQFSTPLPLAQSGAAIYGFKGQFAMNGERKLGSSPDPIKKELDWWAAPPGSKYEPEKDQYAIGVGVVVGTMPDVSFAFSASGMVVVAFPDPEVILGVDVKVIEVPNKTVTDEGAPSGTITGLIVIDDEAVKVAVSAQYTIPKILELKVPFGAYFPYSGEGTYVRLGSDGQTDHDRYGEPITIKLLPGTLDVQAWAYLMIEQDGLPYLGGEERFSFKGFSIGFGAGWGIKWSAGPIKLSASAKVLVGFGSNPLMIKGGVFVAGELDLVVLSISARGELILTYLNENVYLEGKFCGEVDLFFFSIKGCVGVSIGTDNNSASIPPPEPPLTGVSLTDRRDRIMGEATTNGSNIQAQPIFAISDDGSSGSNSGVSIDDNNTVWADTAPVLHFSHYVKNGLDGSSQFSATATPTQPIWFGGNRLKYTYKIDSIVLRRKNGGALVSSDSGKLKTAWMTSPYRQLNSSGEDNPIPSEHEGPNLKLLDWNPWNWVVNMDDGAESTDGDPTVAVEDLCDPVPQARRSCVYGRASRGAGWYSVRMRQETPAEPPYPSYFMLKGGPLLRISGQKLEGRDIMLAAVELGVSVRPGMIVELPFHVPHGSLTLQKGYCLPWLRKAVNGGLEDMPLPWEATFDRELSRPQVTLLICDAEGQQGEKPDRCINFEGLKPSGEFDKFTFKQTQFISLDSNSPLRPVDWVDTRPNPDQRGNDGRADINFPDSGMKLILPYAVQAVELSFMKFNNAAITIEAFDNGGGTVDSATANGPQGTPIVVSLTSGRGISILLIKGGQGEAVLYRICLGEASGETVPEETQNCEDFSQLKPDNRKAREIDYHGFHFEASDSNRFLHITDKVDQSAASVVTGQDGHGEIQFPHKGMMIKLASPCEQIELGIMHLLTSEKVEANAFDADGNNVAFATTKAVPLSADFLRLKSSSKKLITHVLLSGGADESVLFRICCLAGEQPEIHCMNFKGLKLPRTQTGVSSFEHMDIAFRSLSRRGGIRTTDVVDDRKKEAIVGRDHLPEINFDDEGLRIRLPKSCQTVQLKVMLLGSPVKAQALNVIGAQTDNRETPSEQRVEHIITLEGPDIRTIVLSGGKGRAVLYEICCSQAEKKIEDVLPLGRNYNDFSANFSTTRRTMMSATAMVSQVPVVSGIIDDEIMKPWPGKVLLTRGKCQVVTYEPEKDPGGGWSGFQIKSPKGKKVILLSVCGIDQIMVNARNEDSDNRQETNNLLTDLVVTAVDERREVLLEAGAQYEVVVDWSYQSWQSSDDGVDEPPDTLTGTWLNGGNQTFYFGVAAEDASTDNTQDGLNEYVFDARDINRHLVLVEPADGRSVHFTDDPIWAHFDAAHMKHLLEQYGRELQIEVSRTDPPPQSTPASLRAILAPLIPLTGSQQWSSGPVDLMPLGYQRINQAITAMPCLSEGPVVGGASLSAQFDLLPNAMYDLRILAPKTDGSEPVVVSATRFISSRYADPQALIESLGFMIGTQSPYRPDDIILPAAATLPSGDVEVSDGLIDELLRQMDVETLPLPHTKAKCYAIWRQFGSNWKLEGVLLDSLESLNRNGAVRSGSGSLLTTRCKISAAHVSGHSMSVVRANENWTRVFLKPALPLTLNGAQLQLLLEFETSGSLMTGSRTLSAIPAIIDREGL